MVITVAITGASGSIYARQLLEKLSEDTRVSTIYVIFSDSGKSVWNYELGEVKVEEISDKIEVLDNKSFYNSIASGSSCADCMVIVPASMGSVGRIASGVSGSLIERAADVQLKEREKLILVVRESPLSLIHLQNLTKLTEAGAMILPASPSFYSKPQSVDEVAMTITERVLDKIGLKSSKNFRWVKK